MKVLKFLGEIAGTIAILSWFIVHIDEVWAVPVVIGIGALIGINAQLTQLNKQK